MDIKIEGMAPLIQVFDMPVSLKFYRDILGFSIAMSSGEGDDDDVDWVLLKLNNMELMLNTAYERGLRP
jgi:glyoxylase I family protein